MKNVNSKAASSGRFLDGTPTMYKVVLVFFFFLPPLLTWGIPVSI